MRKERKKGRKEERKKGRKEEEDTPAPLNELTPYGHTKFQQSRYEVASQGDLACGLLACLVGLHRSPHSLAGVGGRG
jgi:hypothetical protein